MKKIELTEKQKKVLKTAMVVSGSAVCIVAGAKIVSRTEIGVWLKDKVVDWAMRSKCRVNGYELQMESFVSNRLCPDMAVAQRAHDEAYKLWKSIILEAKDAG